jgi:hypothetical protein
MDCRQKYRRSHSWHFCGGQDTNQLNLLPHITQLQERDKMAYNLI